MPILHVFSYNLIYLFPFNSAEDLRMKLSKVYYNPNFSVASRNTYLTDVLPIWLGFFEKLAPTFNKESNDSFFIGDRLTWIDYIMFELIDTNIAFTNHTRPFLTGPDVTNDILEGFPKLKIFYETFSQRPNLQKYLLSSSRLPFILPYSPRPVIETKTS